MELRNDFRKFKKSKKLMVFENIMKVQFKVLLCMSFLGFVPHLWKTNAFLVECLCFTQSQTHSINKSASNVLKMLKWVFGHLLKRSS